MILVIVVLKIKTRDLVNDYIKNINQVNKVALIIYLNIHVLIKIYITFCLPREKLLATATGHSYS